MILVEFFKLPKAGKVSIRANDIYSKYFSLLFYLRCFYPSGIVGA